MKEITKDKRKNRNCVRCNKLCFGRFCWECYTSKKGKYKGRVSTLRSLKK